MGNFDEFEQNFNSGRELAREYDLESLENWIINEVSKFRIELEKQQQVIMTNSTLKERIAKVEIEDYINGLQDILKLDNQG